MGIFNRNRTLPAPTPVTLPSDETTMGKITRGGNAIAGKATDIYRKNPKLVGGLALVASALLLNRLKRPPAP